jgi:hypothetical protein
VQLARPALAAAPAPLVAYSATGLTGRAQRFEAGAYEAARGNLGLVGADAVRSVEIQDGYIGSLCRDAGLLDCVTLPPGRHPALPAGFDLAVSSLRVALLQ